MERKMQQTWETFQHFYRDKTGENNNVKLQLLADTVVFISCIVNRKMSAGSDRWDGIENDGDVGYISRLLCLEEIN